jgi:uncharacterized protein (DUF1684 family)
MRKLLTSISAAAALCVPAAILPAANATAAASRPATVQSAAVQALRGGAANSLNAPRMCSSAHKHQAFYYVCIKDEGTNDATGNRQFKVESKIRNDASRAIVVDFNLYFQPSGHYLGTCHFAVRAEGNSAKCESQIRDATPPVSAKASIQWRRGTHEFAEDIISPEYTS